MDSKTIKTAIACLQQTPGVEIKRLLTRLQLPYRRTDGKSDSDKINRYIRAFERAGFIIERQNHKGDRCILVYPPGHKFKPLFQSKDGEPPCKVYRPGDPDYPGIPTPPKQGFRLAESYNTVEYSFLNSTQKRRTAS